MGTFAEITAYAPDAATAARALDAAYARLDDVNRLMSDYVDDSEIGRLNAQQPNTPLVLSAETFTCLSRAAEISALSGGAFDVTCRPLVWLWKQAGAENKLPTDSQLADTLARVGWQKLLLDPATHAATLTVSNMQVDLGGIAKGYSLDLAAAALVAAGAESGLVNVGGDVVAVGTRPEGLPWRIGLQDPFGEGTVYTLELVDCAVATSGVQQRFSVIEGRRYSHIVDPRSGYPAEQAPCVTVIAADGLTADAWATVFSVLTVAEGQALIAAGNLPRMEVCWISRQAAQVDIQQTPGFKSYIAAEPDTPTSRESARQHTP